MMDGKVSGDGDNSGDGDSSDGDNSDGDLQWSSKVMCTSCSYSSDGDPPVSSCSKVLQSIIADGDVEKTHGDNRRRGVIQCKSIRLQKQRQI